MGELEEATQSGMLSTFKSSLPLAVLGLAFQKQFTEA